MMRVGALIFSASRRTFSSISSPIFAASLASAGARPVFEPTEVIRDLRRGVDGSGAGLQVSRAPKKIARSEAKLLSRSAAVAAGLESQEKRRAEYRKTLPSKASRSGLLQYIKKNAWEKE